MADAPKGRRIDSAVEIERKSRNRESGFHLARTEREAKVIGSHIDADAPEVEFAATALVVIVVGTGCAELQEAQLYANDTMLRVRLNRGADHEECDAPYMNAVFFSVPLALLPPNARYGDALPENLGVGILVSADAVDVDPADAPSRMVEVTGTRQVEDWVEQNGGEYQQVPRFEPVQESGERRFAFLVPACATPNSTRVDIGPDGLPVLVADTSRPYHSEPCAPHEHYLVVYDVPASALPPSPAATAPVTPG